MTLPFETDALALREACESALRPLRIPAGEEKSAEFSTQAARSGEKPQTLPIAGGGALGLSDFPFMASPELNAIVPGSGTDPALSAEALSRIFARDARRFD